MYNRQSVQLLRFNGKFAALNLFRNEVDTLANDFKEIILATAEENTDIGYEILCDKRREMGDQKHTGNIKARMQYQQMHREVR